MSRTTNIIDDRARSQSLRMLENLERAYTISAKHSRSPSRQDNSNFHQTSSNLGQLSIEHPIDESEREYKVPDTPVKQKPSFHTTHTYIKPKQQMTAVDSEDSIY